MISIGRRKNGNGTRSPTLRIVRTVITDSNIPIIWVVLTTYLGPEVSISISSFSVAVVTESDSVLLVAPGGSKEAMVWGGKFWSRWRGEGKYTVAYAWPAYADSPELPIPYVIYIVG